ncbi:MAG TPA: multiheme c-type cytochrome, partial [Bryobacteraceae bacterium]|nr:multiheme c-type cytochrome [Bryobacteraceae bacterium]
MLLLAAVVYVGSAACQPCHPAIAASYAKTAMARSSGPVQSVPEARVAVAGQDYRIADRHLSVGDTSVPFDYFIGSGAHGRSYAFAREGFLYELPVTWYRRRNAWAASPGYEQESEVRLNRPLDTTCLYCHASRLQPIFGTQNKYATPPFLENGIGCERCHGPGGDHVNTPRTARLINPAKLALEARDSVCAQCHLTADARIDRPGRKFAEYRPGDNLSTFATYFVQTGTSDGLKVTSHVEKLAMSACARSSGTTLWCGRCHDPHTGANHTQAACLNCHAQAHHQTEACADCHMPKATAIDAAHGVFTDHSIRRIPAVPRTDQA